MNTITKYIVSLVVIGVFFGAFYAMRDSIRLNINLAEPTTKESSLSAADVELESESSDVDVVVNDGEPSDAEANMPEESIVEENKPMLIATLKTNQGDIVLELFPDDAPKTVENFVTLAKDGFYNSTKFHRIIKNFMIQGGDPLSKDDNKADDGTGGPGYTFEDEINDHKLERGALAMANSGPNTNGSQFFIITAQSTPWLDGLHTVFGKVIAGMEVVTYIESAPTNLSDYPIERMIINEILIDGE